jgi:hypothetical protein
VLALIFTRELCSGSASVSRFIPIFFEQKVHGSFLLDQGGQRRPSDFYVKMCHGSETGLAQQTASLACLPDQLHRESVDSSFLLVLAIF